MIVSCMIVGLNNIYFNDVKNKDTMKVRILYIHVVYCKLRPATHKSTIYAAGELQVFF